MMPELSRNTQQDTLKAHDHMITKKKQTIKLPVKNYEISLKNFVTIENQNNFKKYKLFDYRINYQLILK